MKQKKIVVQEKDKRFLTLLILFFPSILLVALSNIYPAIYRIALQLLVALWQVVIMKNMLDEYYGV